MEFILSPLVVVAFISGYIYLLGIFSSLQYDKYMALVLSIVISTTTMGSIYTLSLLFHDSLLGILLLLLLAFIYSSKTIKFSILSAHPFSTRALFLCFLTTLVFIYFCQKWGGWDAWAIWNLHAKFMYNPDTWTAMFDPRLEWSHADYPMLLPATIALFWRTLHGVYASIPASLALINFILIVILLNSKIKSYTYVSVITIGLLLLDFNFVEINAAQYADSYLALIYLIVTILYIERPKYFMFVIGLLAATALSIKNEGYIFTAITILYTIVYEDQKIVKLKSMALGIAPLLLIAIYFKLSFAPTNDLVAGQSWSIIDKLLDPMRYFHIIRFSLETLFTKHYTFVILLLLFYKQIGKVAKEYRLVLFTLLTYLAIYIITPKDLIWHMSTSMKRLFHHIYPAAIFILISSTNLGSLNSKLSEMMKRWK